MYKNDKAVGDGVTSLLIFLVISLTFSSIAIAWFLLQIYGVSVAGISYTLPTGSTTQNFVDDTTTADVLQLGSWNYQAGIGRVATSATDYLIFDNVYSNNNYVYTNNYVINNSLKQDYSIVLEYTSAGMIEIITKNDGFYYHSTTTIAGVTAPDTFFPYPNANQITNAEINVEYNPTSYANEGLVYNLNGVDVIKIPFYQLYGVQAGLLKKYYGGVGAKHVGLTVKEFTTTNDRASDDWALFTSTGIAFLSTLLHIIVWNVDAQYLPIELNLIFIKPQLLGIVACVIAYARG